MFRFVAILVGLLGVFASTEGDALYARVLNEWYGSGVHAYFSGDYARAHQELSRAIDAGTKDPRCYYFRAMAELKIGRDDEAVADMKTGAKLETQDADGFYPVNRSLERIQGRSRLTLQKYRRQARTAAYEADKARSLRRYEQLRRNERDVLRRRVKMPLENLAPSSRELTVVVEEDPSKTPLPVRRAMPPEEPDEDMLEAADVDDDGPEAADIDWQETPTVVGKKMKAGTLGRLLLRISGVEKALSTGQKIGQSAARAAGAATEAVESMRGGKPPGEGSPLDEDPFGDE